MPNAEMKAEKNFEIPADFDMYGKNGLGESRKPGHVYTKKEFKQMGKAALIDIAAGLQEVIGDLEKKLENARLVIDSLRSMPFWQKTDQGKYVNPEKPPCQDKTEAGSESDSSGKSEGTGESEKGGKNGGKGKRGKRDGKGRNKESGTDQGTGQSRQKYGKGGSSSQNPRRHPGCQAEKIRNLPTVTVTHTLKDEELLEKFGTLDGIKAMTSGRTKEVIRIPAVELVVEHVFVTYVKEDQFSTSCSAGEIKLVPGSLMSASLMASVLYDRFCMHLPMNRIAEDLRTWGYDVGDDALPRWSILLATKWMEQFYLRLTELLLEHSHIQVDETFFRVVHDGRGPGACSYMWIMLPSESDPDAKPITLYVFDETRGTDVLRCTLAGYTGTISCDGFTDYPLFAKESGGRIVLATCWAHVRARFARVCKIIDIKSLPVEKRSGIPCHDVLVMLGEMFREERKLKGLSASERLKGRQEKLQPLVDRFFAYLKELHAEGTATGDAVNYALNMESTLRTFLSDPLVPMTNSNCERAALQFALGRNGFKQKDSLDGAYADSIFLTIAQTAKRSGVNGFLYFQYLIEELPRMLETHPRRTGGGNQDLSYLDILLPWGDDYRKYEQEHMALAGSAAKAYAVNLYSALGYSAA